MPYADRRNADPKNNSIMLVIPPTQVSGKCKLIYCDKTYIRGRAVWFEGKG